MATQAPTPTNAATIVRIDGKAYLQVAPGQLVALKPGDRIEAGQVLVVDDKGQLQVRLANGDVIMLGGGRSVLADNEFLSQEVVTANEAAIAAPDADAQRVIAALNAGQDPFAALDPTAAGVTGIGGDQQGHGFVRLMRIGEDVDGTSFGQSGANISIDLIPPGFGQGDDEPVTLANTDSISVAEDGSVTFTLTDNDRGGASQTLTITSINGQSPVIGSPVTVSNGTVTVNSDGSFTFVPTPDYNGPVSFPYTVTDGTTSSSAQVNINVTPVNDGPTADNDSASTVENVPVTIDALTGDTDPDGDPLQITQITQGGISRAISTGSSVTLTEGSVTLNANGTLSFAPNTGYVGPVNFQYTVSDPAGATSVGSITVTVAGNTLPDTTNTASAGPEDSLVVVTLNGSDPDGPVNSFRIDTLPANGSLFQDAARTQQINAGDIVSGPVYFLPDTDWNGNTSFQYAARDLSGAVDSTPATASISVTPVNDAPEAASGIISANEGGAPVAMGLAAPSDEDGDTLTITVTGLPTLGQVQLSDGTPINNGDTLTTSQLTGLIFVPPAFYNGSDPVGNFSYSVSDGTESTTGNVSISVVDIAAATLSLAATPAVAEGGSITYTATLTSAANTPLNVTLSNGIVIAIAAGSTTGSAIAAAPADDVYVDAGTLSTSIAATSGGGISALTVDSTPAQTSVSDTIDTVTATLSATPSVSEGDSIIYTAALTAPAQSAVTVTLSNGSSITIPAGASNGSISIASADNAYAGGGSVSASITAASGGNFEDLQFNATPVTTTLTDDSDTTTLSLSASPSVAEGGAITYTATLDNAAQTPLTVTLSNGASITIAAGATSGSIAVAAPGDDVYVDAGSIAVTVSDTSGGNFENLVVDPAPAVTTVTDTPDTTTVALSGSASVVEGGNITYTAALTSPAQTAVTVSLSNGAQIVIASGASSASVSVPAPADDVYVDAGNVSVGITTASGGNFENLVIDPTAVSTAVSDSADTTTVSLSASPSVAEGGAINYTVSLTAPAQSAVTVTLSNGATITIAAGSASGSTSVAAPTDDVYLDAGNVSASITGASGGNFEVLAIDASPAVTAISDTIDATSITLSASPSVAEGGTITYTATLSNPAAAGAPVSVTLSNGAVITIAGGASSASVSVPAPTDDVYLDAGSVSATITAASGGNLESVLVDNTPAVTAISDTIDATTVSLTASPSVAEGGNITFTAALTSPAQTPVTVTLSNGSTITIAAGASSGSASVAAPADDVYLDAGNVSASITGATGGNFENLVVDASPALTAISDTLDTSTVSLTASPSVSEGGNITYTASLTSPSQSPVTVTLSNGATITIAAGAASGSVSIAAPADDVYIDAGNVTASITNATGGNFENLAINAAPAVTAITDTVDATTVSLTASPAVAEGGNITYTASLTSPAQSAVAITLSNGAVINIAAGSASGAISVPAPTDDAYLDASNVSASLAAASGGNFESLVLDSTPAVTAITDTLDITTVSLTASASVTEGGNITYTAALTNPAGSAMTVTLSNGATISIAAGSSSGSVSVAAPGDDVYVDAGNVSATITNTNGGNFENVAINPAAATTAITDTVDTTTLSLTASPSVAEGGNIIYTASLTSVAQSAVTVTLSNGATITIAAGSASGAVSVAAPADDVYIDAGSVAATITNASGGNFENLAVNPAAATTAITDTVDTTTVSLTASPSVAEGGNITYTASLTSIAQSAVTVTLSNGATITIAAGSASGAVSLAAPADDVYLDAGSVAASISGATGGNFENLAINASPVVTAITDTVDTTTVSLTASASVAEGGNITYTAALTSIAQSAVTVTLSNGAIITIAAGASSGSVSLAAPSDDVYLDAGSVSASIATATGGNFENLSINATPATTSVSDTIDVTTVSLSASTSVAEGGNITYTASLTSIAQSAVTVTLSNGASIIIAAGASSGSVAVAAPADDVYLDASNVSATISNASGGNFENLIINAAPAVTAITDTPDNTTVSLTASATVAEGGNITYTASLNNVAQTPVTVVLSNGATIIIAAGASAGSVAVPAPTDDVHVDAGSVSATISSAAGGNFETLAISPAAATTSITDTIDTTTVSLAASASVAEGGTITYTASLTSQAQTPVTVTLSNGATITIAAGSSSGSVSVSAPADDVYVDAGNLSASISGATGGNFENLVVDATPAVTAITDTLDASTLSLSASLSVAEGGNITYTAALSSAAQSPVTVTLSNGATITIAAGASSGSVAVAAPTDDVYLDAGSVAATISAATGGNFENLTINPAAATTAITDTVDATNLTLTATPLVGEGGSIVYTASLNNPAGTAMSVTLSNGAVISIAAGASSGNVSVAAPSDDVYLDSGAVSATISSTTGGNFENLVVSPAAAITSISDTLDTTTLSLAGAASIAEGASGNYSVSLTSAAQTAVTVSFTYSGTAADGSDFTGVASVVIAAGSSSADFNITSLDDVLSEGAESFTISISSATGGNFENLVLSGTASSVTTNLIDNDVATVSLSATPTLSEAGGNIVYTASITQAPVSAMTVTLSNGATITIAAGSLSGSTSVPLAASDDVYVDPGSVTASISSTSGGGILSAIDPTPAITSITDTLDATNLSLSATPAVAEGGNITYTALLSNPAGTPVTVTLSNGAVISIAAGSTTGTVSVAAPADDVHVDAGNVSASIASASGGNFENLVVSSTPAITTVSDTIDATTLSLSASASVSEGGSIVYTALLTSPASGAMTVTLSNGSTINIASGSSSGSITLPAPTDDVYLDAGNVSLSISGASGGNFEQLVIDNSPAVTAVADTIDTVTATLTATASVVEGGAITYTVSLPSLVTGTPVTVTLSNGATISIPVGASSGSAIVTAADNVHAGGGSASANISAISGGNFENLVASVTPATTTITDDGDITTLSLSGTPTVSEGGSIVYTATLSSPADTPVTVTLSNGATINIAAGSSFGTLLLAAPGDDVYVDAGSLSVSISSAAGGNFESLSVDNTPVVTSVTDTIDTVTATLTATASVVEGGAITYTVSLPSLVTGTPVSVTLSNGATISIPVGASSGSTVVTAADNVYAGGGSASASISTISGGNFENLIASATPATTSITDDADVTTLSLSATPSVAEGGSIIYTAALTSPAASNVTVTLSNGATITITTGNSTGNVSVAAPSDDVYLDAGSVSATISSASGGGFENLVVSATPATTSVTDTIDTVTATLTATASVVEGGAITYTVSLPSLVTGTPVSVTLSNGSTITIPVGASSGSAIVTAADNVYAGGGSASASISTISGGNFENLLASATPATTTITDDADVTTLSLSATPSVAEGGSIIYTATLSSPAASNVTVTLSNGTTITITTGNSTGNVSVAAPGDDVYLDAGSVSATITSATGGGFENLVSSPTAASTSITDTVDTTTLTLTATSSITEGGSIVYTASLNNPAGTAMSVTLSNGAVVSIAAGASSGTVSVPAPSDDAYLDAGSVSATISGSTGGNFENLVINPTAASTAIADTIDTTTLSLSGASSVVEGASASYTVSLNNPAQSAVTVNIGYSGTAADGTDYTGVATVTIAAGSSSANFSIATLDDAFAEGAESITLSLASATGGNFENLVISGSAGSLTTTLVDNDGPPTVNVSDISVVEGDMAVFVVSLSNLSATDTTFTPVLANGTATIGSDTGSALEYFNGSSWVPVTGAGVTIAAGASAVQVRVATTDDAIAEGSESFTLTANVTAGTTANASASGTASINDEAAPDTVLLSISGPATVTEGNATGNYTLSLSQAAVTPVTVMLNYAGTASNGSDYTGVISVVIPAGASSATFSLNTLDDVIADSGETIVVSLGSISGGGFEAIAAHPTSNSVSTTINDEASADVTTVTLTANPTVAEGGTITYTATLNNTANSPVTVTLSTGQTITIAAGQSTGSVNIAAPGDDPYIDAGNVSRTISSATGGGFESLAVNPAAAVTAITDTTDNTTLSLSATSTVAEGGNITYTATLSNAAQTPLTVTLTGGATITIAAGNTTGSVSLAAPGNDPYIDAGTVSRSITAASGGNFENLVINPAPATTSITDSIDTTTLTLSADASVAEGSNITYTATLNNPAGTTMTVTLSNGAVINIAAGAMSGTVSVAAPGDDVYLDAGNVSATISSASGGNLENLAINPAAATTAITDTIATTTVALSATPSVAEGGAITYTATLSNAAQTPVTVTLTGGSTITIAAGDTTGSISLPAPNDDVYIDAGSISRSITAASGGNFENLSINPAAATTTITDTVNPTTVTLSASPSVAEGGSIVYTATLTNAAQTSVTVTITGGGTITIAAGDTTGSVSVLAPADDVYIDAGSVSRSITAASGGNFENLTINPTAASTTVSDTIDITTLSLTGAASIAEGASGSYTVSLTSAAQTAVTVTLSYSGTAANGVDYTGVASVTIPAGSSSANFSIATLDDAFAEGSENFTVRLASASGGNFENLAISGSANSVTTSITDEATADTVLVSITGPASVTEGAATGNFSVSLGQAALTAVTVNLNYSGTAANGADYTGVISVIVPAGASSATFSIPTIDDAIADSGETIVVSLGAISGGGFEAIAAHPTNNSVTTTISDEATPDTVLVSLTGPASVVEGAATGNYTVSLGQAASTPVTVNLAYSGTAANGSDYTGVVSVIVPAGATNATFNLATLDDAIADSGETIVVSLGAISGGGFEAIAAHPTNNSVTTTISDEATPDTVLVSIAGPASVAEGVSTGNYTVSLAQAAVTPVTVNLSYSGTAANDADYTGVVSVIIPAGATNATFNLATLDDAIADSGETIIVSLGSISGGGFEAIAAHPTNNSVTTVINDEATPDTVLVSLTGPASVTEGAATGNFTLSLPQAAVTAITVNLNYSGTAANGSDYTGVLSVVIPAGASSATFSIPTIDDAIADSGETIVVSLGAISGGGFEAIAAHPTTNSATTTISDEVTPDSVLVSLTGPSAVTEGASTGNYTVSLAQAAVTPVTVNLSYTGTAANGSDYTGVISVIVPAGATNATFNLATLDDAIADSGETIVVSLGAISGGGFEAIAAHPTNNSVTTTISDEATPDTVLVSIAGPASVTEGSATGNYTVSLSQAAVTPVTINLGYGGSATGGGTDYTGILSVTIPAGATSATFTLPTTNDTLDEPNETIVVSLGAISGGGFEAIAAHPTSNNVTTTITDNDPTPSLSINDVIVNEAAGTASFTVTLSAASAQTVTVNYATSNGSASAGSDYTSSSGTLTFNPGQTSRTITVPITNDLLAELSENFNVTLSAPSNATISDGTGVGTITDNDTAPVIDLDANNSSGATGANYTLSFTEGTGGAGPSIADIDLAIGSVSAPSLAGATIVLTNRQPGDALNLGTDVGGISVNTVSTAGSVTITLSGAASVADYIQRIRNISFINNDDNPNTVARTVTVQVTDGVNASNVATTTVNVIPVNDPPLGQNATVTTNEDTAFVFTLANFPMNDAEQGNGVNPNAVRIDSLPVAGSLTLNGVAVTAGQVVTAADISGGLLQFTPALNANGNNYASFNFSVRDAANAFDPAPNTVTVNVTPVSDGTPVAVNDSFATVLGTPITLTAAQLMSNDTLFDNPTITATGGASGGTLVNNGNGTWTFTPSAAGNGSFTYTITDSDGQTSTATVNINTYAANNDLATVHESALAGGTGGGTAVVSGNLLANDGPTANSISNVGGVSDGGAGDTDIRTGYIGVNTARGNLVVDTTGTGAGDYVYTLESAANNNTAATNNSVTETIAYTANTGAANLQVTVVDDRPQAFNRVVQVAEGSQPSYNLVLTLDISRSMTFPEAGGEVQIVNPDGSISITTRLDMAKAALADLVSEYFEHSQNVSVKIVTFAGPNNTGTVLNGNVAFTSEAAALAAIDGITVASSGGTNYDEGITAAQTAFGTPSGSVQNISYFLSDGLPTSGNMGAQTAWNTFAANNNIKSYALGIGTGIASTTALDSIHNVDADGSGVRDSAIIVPDLNDLSATLTSSVPVSYGGNVVGGGASSVGSALGADGGWIQSVSLQLDTNANGSPDTTVTFNYNQATNQISWTGGFPSGSPITSDTLVLNASRGFTLGTLNFNFSTGEYSYFTGGAAVEGNTFNLSFIARDGDGDVTPSTNLRFDIVDGVPVARPDFDSLSPNATTFTGNVISGLGTDSGLASGTLATDFTALGAGADTIADNAVISSIQFQGQTFNLGSNSSGNALGGSYTVSGGRLTWTHGSNGSTLTFDNDGYYSFRPPTADIPNPALNASQTVTLTAAGNLTGTGLTLQGLDEFGSNAGITYTTGGNGGAGVTGGGVVVPGGYADGVNDNTQIDGLETLVFNFDTNTHPRGVENIRFNVNDNNSNLSIPTSGNDYNSGRSLALTYSVYHIDGHLLGSFVSQATGLVTLPSQFSNVGRVEVQASSDAEARITDVRFQSIQLDSGDAAVAPVEIGYTLTDSDGDTSSSVLNLHTITNAIGGDDAGNTLSGTNANDQLSGLAGNDTLNGGAGHDLLDGGIGNDSLSGGDGNDKLFGGAGNDTLSGDAGNDRLTGGGGNDLLIGGTGSDVFVWTLADRGAAGTPAVDTIQSFDNATAGAGGDVLDLRDLLQGESHTGNDAGSLLNYLHFESSGGNTTVQISSGGGFTSGYNAAYVDQTIVLQGVDLTSGGTLNDQLIIQNLLTNGKLQAD